MRQSVLASWLETIGSTATGFVLSLCLQYVICWWWDLPLRLHDNLLIIAAFTVLSIVRGFFWRRLMERLHVRRSLSPFMQAVVAERYRQIEQEGWSAEHDDAHPPSELAHAGACYAMRMFNHLALANPPTAWRWDKAWWKPADPRRNLVKSAALIIAEGERFDRLKTKRGAA